MARYFVNHGWKDITIAFPLNPAEIEDIDHLASQIRLNVLVENYVGVAILSHNLKNSVGVFIKIDAGYHRTGIDVGNHQSILKLIRQIEKCPQLKFQGFIVHNGHTYNASGTEEILAIHDRSLQQLSALKQFMLQNGVEAIYSIGDTPAMSQTENFEGIDEIRPGNFVFFDVMQQFLGSCNYSNIAVAFACPVVAKHQSRHEIVFYGGAVHLSKDFILDSNGNKVFGKVVELSKSGWESPLGDTYVKSLSQEHGIVKASQAFYNKIEIGDFIGILPVHSCLTVDAMGEMFLIDGTKLRTIHS